MGFNDSLRRIKAMNSYGRGWGDDGYFYLPYQFVENTDYCDDCWTIEEVE